MLTNSKSFISTFLIGRWLDWLMVFFAGLAWISTPLILLRGVSVFEEKSAQILIGAVGLGSFALLLLYFLNIRVVTIIRNFLEYLLQLSLGWILIIGLFIRLFWIMNIQAVPTSDGAVYIGLANDILSGRNYEVAGTRAYWPPGYPIFLSVWLSTFSERTAIVLSQLALYVIGCLGTYRLTHHFAGVQAARLSALLFTLWPNIVSLVVVPEKEMLVMALLPWVTFWAIAGSNAFIVSGGILLGFAVLVQPSLQLLIVAVPIAIIFIRGQSHLVKAVLFFSFAILIVLPWSVRNHIVFEKFVLVSTNGGYNLYRSNNPLATGGYTDRGSVSISHLSEIEMDTEAKRLAVEWIENNKAEFITLMFEKQLRFMGDDSSGIYASVKQGNPGYVQEVYVFLKVMANAWWLIAWLAIALMAIQRDSHFSVCRSVVWFWLYLFLIHSVFESNGKYHVPTLWVLCVFIACLSANLYFRSTKK